MTQFQLRQSKTFPQPFALIAATAIKTQQEKMLIATIVSEDENTMESLICSFEAFDECAENIVNLNKNVCLSAVTSVLCFYAITTSGGVYLNLIVSMKASQPAEIIRRAKVGTRTY